MEQHPPQMSLTEKLGDLSDGRSDLSSSWPGSPIQMMSDMQLSGSPIPPVPPPPKESMVRTLVRVSLLDSICYGLSITKEKTSWFQKLKYKLLSSMFLLLGS